MGKKKVLLIRPSGNESSLGEAGKKLASSVPPLGLLYIASFLKNNGIETDFIDNDLERNSFSQLSVIIKNYRPDIIGITAVTAEFSETLMLARMCKSVSGALLVIGGPHASGVYSEILEKYPEFDIVIRGEGELPFLDLARGNEWGIIRGISYRLNNRIIHNAECPRIENLDALPFPDFDQVDLPKYKDPFYTVYGSPTIPIVTARGCPFECVFCASKVIFGRKVVSRSVGNVMEEIDCLIKKYPCGVVRFFDDTFTLDKKRTLDFCEKLKKRNIRWICSVRADSVNYDLLKCMKESGCCLIQVGVESGSSDVLKEIKKNTAIEQARAVFRWAHKLNLDSWASFIIGLPGDDAGTIKETMSLAKEINPLFALFFPPVPYPGTELYAYAKKRNLLLFNDWTQICAPKYKKIAMRHVIFDERQIAYLVKKAYKAYYFRIRYILVNTIVGSLYRPKKIVYLMGLAHKFIKYFC
jgi:radical SAM superfamily enzyme YgiQ (UPF0313 family)